MKFFKDKRGIVTHPVGLFIMGVILGLVLAYLWINYTSIPHPFGFR
ncbi:MAG: hypothetical protein QGH34_03785 [Candidatus Woesearchaeota archaeon]|jgi:hypothetical protein|nr:hypothetical protein [Candidatus Woesearchaeota archaeon]